MAKIPFPLGDGTTVDLEVTGYADGYPRGAGDSCAFCGGDPCNEHSHDIERARSRGYEVPELPEGMTEAPIVLYDRNMGGISTCPVCEGRPT